MGELMTLYNVQQGFNFVCSKGASRRSLLFTNMEMINLGCSDKVTQLRQGNNHPKVHKFNKDNYQCGIARVTGLVEVKVGVSNSMGTEKMTLQGVLHWAQQPATNCLVLLADNQLVTCVCVCKCVFVSLVNDELVRL